MKGEILDETLRLTREQARIAGEEMKLGDRREIDYLDILAQVKDLELELAAARRDEARTVHDFGKLIGLERGETRKPRGGIDENYLGTIKTDDEASYLLLARKNSTDLEKTDRELFDLRETLRREERSWMPELTAKLELSMLGTSFPLTQPGFSLGLDFAFNTADLPGLPPASPRENRARRKGPSARRARPRSRKTWKVSFRRRLPGRTWPRASRAARRRKGNSSSRSWRTFPTWSTNGGPWLCSRRNVSSWRRRNAWRK